MSDKQPVSAPSPRFAAVQVLEQVLRYGRSLSTCLPGTQATLHAPRDRALLQDLCFGVLRWYPRLDALLAPLLSRGLKARDTDVRAVLLLGLYQILHQRIPDHAAVSESVTLAGQIGKPWARGLINAVLRQFLRRRETREAQLDQPDVSNDAARLAHPAWLLDSLRSAWPDDWHAVASAANQAPPMTLRVNRRQGTRADYLQRLTQAGLPARPARHAPDALILDTPCAVDALPGFTTGAVSVQDAAAQLAAGLLAPRTGERVLDACAAPGGKSAHLLESQSGLSELVALDINARRLAQVAQNLTRLGLTAHCITGDAARPETWWDGRPFERILLDAPCSAIGVIRRHPDIKVLRRAEDIPTLVTRQHAMLTALWPLLKPGGILLYATCSILPAENHVQIRRFLAEYGNASLQPITGAWGRATGTGRQILPGEDEMDGFFYACLYKT